MLNLRRPLLTRRVEQPTASVIHNLPSVTHSDEYPMYAPAATVLESFGPDFNLIRAVQETGPVRIAAIRDELVKLDARTVALTNELQTLERMIAITHDKPDTNVTPGVPVVMSFTDWQKMSGGK